MKLLTDRRDGLTYFIRHDAEPQDRVLIYLVKTTMANCATNVETYNVFPMHKPAALIKGPDTMASTELADPLLAHRSIFPLIAVTFLRILSFHPKHLSNRY